MHFIEYMRLFQLILARYIA